MTEIDHDASQENRAQATKTMDVEMAGALADSDEEDDDEILLAKFGSIDDERPQDRLETGSSPSDKGKGKQVRLQSPPVKPVDARKSSFQRDSRVVPSRLVPSHALLLSKRRGPSLVRSLEQVQDRRVRRARTRSRRTPTSTTARSQSKVPLLNCSSRKGSMRRKSCRTSSSLRRRRSPDPLLILAAPCPRPRMLKPSRREL